MHREVEINIPMFIGIILLVAVATAVLVYGVNMTREIIMNDNKKMEEGFGYFSNILNIESNSDVIEEINDINNL